MDGLRTRKKSKDSGVLDTKQGKCLTEETLLKGQVT